MNYPYYQQMMPQNYMQGRPTYMDSLTQQNASYLGIKGRPVTSIDEARASMIDLDGSVFYFPDAANQRIYTKQINLDGTSSLKTYVLMENPILQQQNPTASSNQPSNFVTREELDAIIKKFDEEIQTLKGASNKNDEPTTSHNGIDVKF